MIEIFVEVSAHFGLVSSLFLKGRHLLVITVTAGPPPGLRLARACHGSRQLKVTATRSAYHDGQQWQSESEPESRVRVAFIGCTQAAAIDGAATATSALRSH